MPKQRGVKRLPDRCAGPYCVGRTSERGEMRWARDLYVYRRCDWGDDRSPDFPRLQSAYRSHGITFAESMIAARALFFIERVNRGKVAGIPYTEIRADENDRCGSWQRYMFWEGAFSMESAIEKARLEMEREG